jgi:hypothetical protein
MTYSESDNSINFLFGSITPIALSTSIYFLNEPKSNQDQKFTSIVNGFLFASALSEGNVDNLLGEIFIAGAAISFISPPIGLTISTLALIGEAANHFSISEFIPL